MIAAIQFSYSQWEQCNIGLEKFITYSIKIDGYNIFICTSKGIYLSTDLGNTWISKNRGLTDLCVYSIALSGNNIFAGTRNKGIFLSTDYGKKCYLNFDDIPVIKSVISLLAKNDIVVAVAPIGINISTNSGNLWNSKELKESIYSIYINCENIYVGTWGKIFLSLNYGEEWIDKSIGLPIYSKVNSIIMN